MIRITDTNKSLPDLQPPEGIPVSVETPQEDLPEGGFDWLLIHQLASEIRHERKIAATRFCCALTSPTRHNEHQWTQLRRKGLSILFR